MTETKVLEIHKQLARTDLPDLKAGMKVRVWYRVQEKDRWRTTYFEGIIIAIKHGQKTLNSTFTVRRVGVDNIGVEMTWPLHSPVIEKIEILQTSKTRRAKLYYLRARSRRGIRAKLKATPVVSSADGEKKTEASEPEEKSGE